MKHNGPLCCCDYCRALCRSEVFTYIMLTALYNEVIWVPFASQLRIKLRHKWSISSPSCFLTRPQSPILQNKPFHQLLYHPLHLLFLSFSRKYLYSAKQRTVSMTTGLGVKISACTRLC